MRKSDFLLIGLCLAISGLLSFNSWQISHGRAQAAFEDMAVHSGEAFAQRFSEFERSLESLSSYFDASEMVTFDEFALFSDNLLSSGALSAVTGIGIAGHLDAGEQGTGSPTTSADLGPKDHESSVTYFHPRSESEPLLGQLLHELVPGVRLNGTQRGARLAMTASSLEGAAQNRSNMMMLSPLPQQSGLSTNTEIAFLLFDTKLALKNLTANQAHDFQISVFDVATDRYIFQGAGEQPKQSTFQHSYIGSFYGRELRIEHNSTVEFEARHSNFLPLTLLIIGVLISVSLVLSIRQARLKSSALRQMAAMRARETSAREEENRSIIENALTAVLILDGHGEIIVANQAAAEVFDFHMSEMVGVKFDQFLDPNKTQLSDESRTVKGIDRAGKTLTLEVQKNSWVNADGERRVTAIVRNLTKEHDGQLELEKTKTLYDIALRGAQIGVFDVDLVNSTSEVTETWRNVLRIEAGRSHQDTQAEFISRIHPDDLPRLRAADQACLDGKTPRSVCEFRVLFGTNEWRWLRSDAVVAARDQNGKALRLIGTQTDVTSIHHSRNALEASERQFRRVLEAAPIGMALMDDKGNFLGVNDAICRLCGYDEKELTSGMRLADLLEDDQFSQLYEGVTRLSQNPDETAYSAEHPLIHRSGRACWGQFDISCTYNRNQGKNVFIAQINDISDHKKIEKIKNDFVATVSHELRTPLTSIKGALGLIQASNNALDESSSRLIEIAQTNTDRLTSIVNDILDLEKISTGEIAFQFDTFDMRTLIEDVLLEMGSFAQGHKNTLLTDFLDGAAFVNADAVRTKQVLENLVSNACKYSDKNSDVIVRTENVGNKIVVYVQNTGPGVPEEFRPQMFKAFSQADSSDTRAKGGTGLGLNITKQIVSRHDGEIGFESLPNSVTIFWFAFPMATSLEDDNPSENDLGRDIPQDEQYQVLHIEDDSDFAEIVRSGLSQVAKITLAKSLADARVLLERETYQVVMMDWRLPDGDSATLIDTISKTQAGSRVIALSSEVRPEIDGRVHACLVKSQSSLKTISDCIQGRRAIAS